MPELATSDRKDPDDGITIGVKPRKYEVVLAGSDGIPSDKVLVSTGVDWFSVTTSSPEIGAEWYQAFCKYRNRYPLLIEEWYHQGGYRGQKCVGVHYGESKKYGYIFRATGSAAKELVTWMSFAKERNFRVTRIDLKLDMLLNEKDERVASTIFYDNYESKRPRFKLVRATEGGGETVYVGSPVSASSARIYDKGAESKSVPGFKWRYEVVYRKPLADGVYDDFREACVENRADAFVVENIGSWLVARGVTPPWVHNMVAVPVLVKERTPWENKLLWLKTSVAKTVHLLKEAGYEKEVKEIFDL